MSKVPSARSIREARLNLNEALAHLDVAGKAIRARNPIGVSAGKKNFYKQPNAKVVKKGNDLYKKFRKCQPAGIREYNLNVNDYENLPATYLGLMSAIEYTTVRGGKTERYRHVFTQMASPAVYRIGTGMHLIRTVDGRYKFGRRGFVDHKVWKRHNPHRPDYGILVEVGTLDAYELRVSHVDKLSVVAAGKVVGRNREFVKIAIPVKSRPILAVTEAGTAIYTLKK